MTATLKINRTLVVDTKRAAHAATDAVTVAMRAALARAGLIDTGATRDQLTATVGEGDRVDVRASGDRSMAAVVHQARRKWATMTPAERATVAKAIKAARGVIKKQRATGTAST